MTAIEEAIKWMDLDKRCGGHAGHCLKCDGVLQRKFDTAESETRNFLADTLCSCKLEDFEAHGPLLWLVALLNTTRYEQFVTSIAKLAPFSMERAWQVIRLSEHNKGNWCFSLEPYRKALFKPRFHLHATLAPLLLAAAVRVGNETEDAVALLDYFTPIADSNPVLQEALPLWRAERVRLEDARRAEWVCQQEQKRIEAVQREAKIQTIEAGGPVAIIRAVLDAATLSACEYPERWAKISERALNTLPREMLEQTALSIACQRPSRSWRGLRSRIEHLVKSRRLSEERSAWLAKFEHSSLPEKLRAACDSQRSLTYFPESWAGQVIREAAGISDELRTQMLSKLARLQRRSVWRTVRQLLLTRI